ncbi:carbamoyl-phosphate synthase small subunit [Candidatus Curtissbacteria bacterium]|nr:carbamoyl-phosphate synthase small subunit [Candidatus Curtissbacteria bacterium]
MKNSNSRLILEDGTTFAGQSFGAPKSTAGEVVFATGMVGYDLSLTDPSYCGQILTFTYPLIGNWGVPSRQFWESEKIQVAGLVISDLTTAPNHWQSEKTLDTWLKEEGIPGIYGIDTRALTQKLRTKGVMLGKIVIGDQDVKLYDPNLTNLVAEVSPNQVKIHPPTVILEGVKRPIGSRDSIDPSGLQNDNRGVNIALLNCGAKRNILRNLLARGATVYELPWNFDPFSDGWRQQKGFPPARSPVMDHERNMDKVIKTSTGGREAGDRTREGIKINGLVISNGPGDPKMAKETIKIIKKALDAKIPTFGICLGNQLLALAAGGDTYKLKFGHRAQNQPTIISQLRLVRMRQAGVVLENRCYITTQNHGFAVSEGKMPDGFVRWFYNANDNTNEGIIHEKLPFFSVQFHPEANPGPKDTQWLFDYFLTRIKK